MYVIKVRICTAHLYIHTYVDTHILYILCFICTVYVYVITVLLQIQYTVCLGYVVCSEFSSIHHNLFQKYGELTSFADQLDIH